MHGNKELFTYLLNSVQTTIPLQILPSTIPGAGSGLFTSSELAGGQEIFRVEKPLVKCVSNEALDTTCDFCFYCTDSGLHPSGRFLTANDERPKVAACSGCKVVRYCSKVSRVTLPEQIPLRYSRVPEIVIVLTVFMP